MFEDAENVVGTTVTIKNSYGEYSVKYLEDDMDFYYFMELVVKPTIISLYGENLWKSYFEEVER